jgi:hypothetical protein
MSARAALSIVLIALATACGGGSPAESPPDQSMQSGAGADLSVPDTWTNFAQNFFATYCVTCHDGNAMSAAGAQDYSQYSQVFRDRATIACGVNAGPTPLPGCGAFPPPGQFPVGNGAKPTTDERARIVQWIQAGAPM